MTSNMLLDDDDDDTFSMLNELKSTTLPASMSGDEATTTIHIHPLQHHQPTRREREDDQEVQQQKSTSVLLQPKPPQAIVPSKIQQVPSMSSAMLLQRSGSSASNLSSASSPSILSTTNATGNLPVARKYVPQIRTTMISHANNSAGSNPSSPTTMLSSSQQQQRLMTTTNINSTNVFLSTRSPSFSSSLIANIKSGVVLSRSSSTISLSNANPQKTITNNNNVPVSNNNNNNQQNATESLRIRLTNTFKAKITESWTKFSAEIDAKDKLLPFTVDKMSSDTISAIVSKHQDQNNNNNNNNNNVVCTSVTAAIAEDVQLFVALLTDEGNGPSLCRKILSGKLSIDQFVTSKTKDLLSDEEKKLMEEEFDTYVMNRDSKAIWKAQMAPCGPFFKCRRCHSRECMMEQKQTSRGDEGTTCFITCTECGLKWKTRQ